MRLEGIIKIVHCSGKVSGVYKITNIINQKCYIGSSVDLYTRYYQHLSLLNKNKHHCKKLQNSFNKHGADVFIFEVLILSPDLYLIKLEQWFMNALKPEYNIRLFAESNRGIKLSDKHKERIGNYFRGINLKEEHKEKIGLANKGKKRSIEFGKLISEMKKGKNVHSIEYLKEIGIRGRIKAAETHFKKVYLLKEDGTVEKEYPSIVSASLDTNISKTGIGKCANGRSLTAGGRKWSYEIH